MKVVKEAMKGLEEHRFRCLRQESRVRKLKVTNSTDTRCPISECHGGRVIRHGTFAWGVAVVTTYSGAWVLDVGEPVLELDADSSHSKGYFLGLPRKELTSSCVDHEANARESRRRLPGWRTKQYLVSVLHLIKRNRRNSPP